MDNVKHTVCSTVGDAGEVSFIWNDGGEIVAYITAHASGEDFSISIYHEPQPPPAVTLAMNTRNECLAALTGFLEAQKINDE